MSHNTSTQGTSARSERVKRRYKGYFLSRFNTVVILSFLAQMKALQLQLLEENLLLQTRLLLLRHSNGQQSLTGLWCIYTHIPETDW